MAVSMKAIGADKLKEGLAAIGPDVQHAADAASKAAAVHMAEKIYQNSPWDTGAMANSIGVGPDQIGEYIVEQVAPYTIFVDLQQAHFSGTYAVEQAAAFRAAAEAGNRALREGTGPEAVQSRFPVDGQYTPGKYER